MNKKEMEEAFDQSFERSRKKGMDRPIGSVPWKYYEANPRTKEIPNNINTSKRMMEIALGNKKTFENPIQLAIHTNGYEEWCEETNVAPSYASLCYYLGIDKQTLANYSHDKTQHICYYLYDTISGQFLFSANSPEKLDKYISRHYVVEKTDENGNLIMNENLPIEKISNEEKMVAIPFRDKVKSGEFITGMNSITFNDITLPLHNLFEMININKAEKARNPAWQIFLAKNNFGNTTQYVDRVEQKIDVSTSFDDMEDSEILKLANMTPDMIEADCSENIPE